MTIDLYYVPGSAPCRMVQMAAKAVGVELNLKLTDLMAGEHMTPAFIKMNPQHTVPTLNDNGFVLWESRAIITYLSTVYGKDDSLYPKDPKKRAVVDQRLCFDQGTLYQRFGDYIYPHAFGGAPLDPEKLKKVEEALGWLNTFLEGNDWVAGGQMTVADISIASSISTMEIVGVDVNKQPNIARWYSNAKKTMPGYEINEAGTIKFKEMVDHLTAKK